MTLTLNLILKAEAGLAKAALSETAKEATKLGAATGTAGKQAQGAAGGVGALGNASGSAATKITALANAEAAAGANALTVGQNHRLAAGGVANLTAQFNDIGVMLAAGQNPLQLAIQQGTQITQVIGPMGAAGAVKALGSALVGMINPVSLITIGSIAAGAAMVQWLTGAGEKVPTLQEAVDDLAAAVDAYEASSKRAVMSTADLRAEFGEAAGAARDMLAELADADLRATERAVKAASNALQETLRINVQSPEIGDQGRLADLFDLSLWSREARGQINGVLSAFKALDDSDGLKSQLGAAEDLHSRIKAVAEATGGISEAEDDVLTKLSDQILAMQRLMTLREAEVRASAENNGRSPGFNAAQDAAYYQFQEQQMAQARASAAQDELNTLIQQNEIRVAALTYGQDSVQVSELQAAAAMQTYNEYLATLDVADSMKDALRQAYEQSLSLANLDTASGIGSAANEAGRLAENLGISLATAHRLARLGPQGSSGAGAYIGKDGTVELGRGGAVDPRSMGGSAFDIQNSEADAFLRNWKPPKVAKSKAGSRRRGGSGTSEVEKQRKALDDLIKREERELALLRETDPVQQEMLRNRDALAGATEAEKAKVEDLITARMREKEAMESIQWVSQQTGDALIDALMGGADAGERLIETLQRAALEALILDKGPLADFLGLSGGGLASSLGIPGFAEGGPTGGSSTSEVRGVVHGREYVFDAAATARIGVENLENLRRGNIKGYMSGGYVTTGATPAFAAGGASMGGAPAGGGLAVHITNQSSTPVVGKAVETTDARGQRQMHLVLSDAVADGMAAPGGKARRTMKQVYGIDRSARQRS